KNLLHRQIRENLLVTQYQHSFTRRPPYRLQAVTPQEQTRQPYRSREVRNPGVMTHERRTALQESAQLSQSKALDHARACRGQCRGQPLQPLALRFAAHE